MGAQNCHAQDLVPALDPVPFHLDEDAAFKRGLSSGWYIFDQAGYPLVGPGDSPEDALSAIHDLTVGPRRQ
jgi:hypothetical protein